MDMTGPMPTSNSCWIAFVYMISYLFLTMLMLILLPQLSQYLLITQYLTHVLCTKKNLLADQIYVYTVLNKPEVLVDDILQVYPHHLACLQIHLKAVPCHLHTYPIAHIIFMFKNQVITFF